MNPILINASILNISRGFCPCGETNGNKYGFCDVINGKRNPSKCKKCGYEFPDYSEYDFE